MLIKMVDDLGAERIDIVYVVAEPELTVLKGTVHFVVALEIVLQASTSSAIVKRLSS